MTCAPDTTRDFSPSAAQAEALHAIDEWYSTAGQYSPMEFYLAGYAGTGKTTLAAAFLEERDLRAVTATFTGKAAHVLRQKGVGGARTIHSAIYEPVPGSSPVEFQRRIPEESPLYDADILVLDEVSMVNDEMADDLRSYGVPILVLGDPGQLPPIRGAGAFTNREPDVFLTEIHRQAAESPILRLATAAREGRPIPECDLGEAVVRGYHRDLIHPALGRAVICGVHRNRWGMTSVIRRDLGLRDYRYPRAGEPLMCCRNSRELGLFNGMPGIAVADAERDRRYLYLKVRMDGQDFDQELVTDPTLFDEHERGDRLPEPRYDPNVQLFDFAYVLTCHKAQGSEFEDVSVLDDSRYFRGDADRWLYTALTRASERLTLMRR